MPDLPRRIIISASSDIGAALAHDWLRSDCDVFGTFRTRTPAVERLEREGAALVHCDLSDHGFIASGCAGLRTAASEWDVLVLAAGTVDPVGPFVDCDFSEWEESIKVNFTAQMSIVHKLLPSRRRSSSLCPMVLFFAGGGTNNATQNCSAYTLSKIALIKAVELLDAEVPDTRFTILGPGWVRTKIHDATLKAGIRAGDNHRRTLEKMAAGDFTPMESVVECCNWLVRSPRAVVGGRNFSAPHDTWGTPELTSRLLADTDMCKLRRHGNNLAARS